MAQQGKKVVILVMTDMDDDDFEIIADNIEFRDRILFLCDRNYSSQKRHSSLNILVDNLKDPSQMISKLKRWASSNGREFSAVIGLDEEYRYRISEAIAKYFGLEHNPRKTLDLCSNKYLQRVALSNAGIGVPNFQLIDASGSAASKARIDFPNVLKLMTGVGSAHIYLNKNQKELNANLKKLIEAARKDSSNPILARYQAGTRIIDPLSKFILESYLPGTEYSCDYIVEEEKGESRGKRGAEAGKPKARKLKARVLRVVKKLEEKGDFGYFAGFYLHNPDADKDSEFRLKGKGGLEELCTSIAQALEIKSGVCMLDFKFHKGKFYVIETTLRPGVATFVELMARQYGHISLSLAIRQRIGLPVPSRIPEKRGIVAYLNAPGKGRITKIDLSYISNSMKKLGILKLHKYCKVGESCINVAYVLASASSQKDALRKFGLIREKSVIEISKNPGM